MKLHVTYSNGTNTTLMTGDSWNRSTLRRILRENTTWLEYAESKYINLSQVVSIIAV